MQSFYPGTNTATNDFPWALWFFSNIFQRKMNELFGDLPDVIVYLDNILLFTKENFAHHLKRLQIVLEIIALNNLHVHIEKTFLTSKKIDYLGYTLTAKGIMPQHNKIHPILRLGVPKTKRKLRELLGFVNYYKTFGIPAATS